MKNKTENKEFILKWRLIALALIFWSSTLIIISVRPPDLTQGISGNFFWIDKINWKPDYDIVIAGDSRIALGVSPSAMNEKLPGIKICNFAFHAAAYSSEYLDSIEKLLKKSGLKIIILGITPHAFQKSAANVSRFDEYKNKHLLNHRLLRDIHSYFKPLRYPDLHKLFTNISQKGMLQLHHKTGWVASRAIPERTYSELSHYRYFISLNDINETQIEELLKRIKAWNRKGIRVYGFFPPISSRMYELEKQYKKFDKSVFTRRFVSVNGIWLRFTNKYHTHDDSHLRYDSAIKFSRDLSQMIKLKEAMK